MLSTKKLFALLLLPCLFLQVSTATSAQAAADANEKALTLKWLGTAGWEIQFGDTTTLIDPFPTRRETISKKRWMTDEEALLKTIKRADYIFAGHSHADHIADIPCIAKHFGSQVFGSRTTTNIALTAGASRGLSSSQYGGLVSLPLHWLIEYKGNSTSIPRRVPG